MKGGEKKGGGRKGEINEELKKMSPTAGFEPATFHSTAGQPPEVESHIHVPLQLQISILMTRLWLCLLHQ